VQLYARTYPLGVQVSASTTRWDARLAGVDSSPLRQHIPLARDAPARAPQMVGGGGVTIVPGVRVGGWASHGAWARASELSTSAASDRQATSGGLEVEVAFAWTRVAAEVTRARLDTAHGRRTLSLAMVEGSQTLSPRWYVAGRLRHAGSEAAAAPVVERSSGEVTLGYRVSPFVTIRSGYYGLRRFGSDGWVHRATVGVLWARRLG
jgi:hypothetical protein